MQTAALRPIRFRPWARPTVVVDLPSPSGVGRDRRDDDVLAARPLGLEPRRIAVERDLGLGPAVRLRSRRRAARARAATSMIGRGVTERAMLEVGREAQSRSRTTARRVVGGCRGRSTWRWAARDRGGSAAARSSTAPTPPGTGVIAPTRPRAPTAKSTSPTRWPSTTLMPTSTTTAPGFSIAPVTRPGCAGGHDHDVGAADVRGEVARSASGRRSTGRVPRVTSMKRDGHPDDRRPTDDDRVARPSIWMPERLQDLDRGVGRRRQEPLVAEAQQAGVAADGSRRCPWPGRCASIDGPQRIAGRQRHLDDDPGDQSDRRSGAGRPRSAAWRLRVASPWRCSDELSRRSRPIGAGLRGSARA